MIRPTTFRTGALGLIVLVLGALPAAAATKPAKQAEFATPEEAVEVLLAAVKADDLKALLAVLGAEAKPLVDSGDPVADQETGAKFVADYEAAHSLVKEGEDKMVLQTGTDDWPFPIPLVKTADGRWRFDTAAGKEEILDRRIGRNEISAINVALAYVDAQREYYGRNPEKSDLLHFAQKFTSTTGKRDGLFWETAEGEDPSPLGPLIHQARGEGYVRKGSEPIPYHGYYYKILTSQGPDASGGKYDYVVRGQMIGGFGLVAYPAEWGASGVMTFVVNHDGIVFQKDLGPKTASLAKAMTTFNPDVSWMRIEPPEIATPAQP